MKKFLVVLFLTLLTSNVYAGGQQTLVTPDGRVLGTASNPLVVTGGGLSSQWTTTGSDIYYNDGNVGIATSTPTTLLDVNGTATIRGTGSSVLFSNGKSINGDTASQLTFDSNIEIDGGKIYSLGAAGLTKTSTNNNGQIVIRKTGGYSLQTAGLSVIGTDNFGGTIVMAQDTNAALTNGKYLGQLLFTGSYDVGTHNLQNGGAAIFGISTGTWSATANPSKLTFEIGDGSVFYRLQRMQITPTGTTIGTNNTTISALLSVGDTAPTKTYIDGTNDIIVKDAIEANGNIYGANLQSAGSITSTGTSSIGWSIVTGANTACNTTCTSACVMGQDTTAGVGGPWLACTDATADQCLCAGAS